MLTQEFIEEMKAKLLSEKARLEQDLSGLAEHTEIGDDLDENASEIQVDEVNQDISNRMKADLKKIETALQKIDDGSYGVDEQGNEISEERLRAIPWADKAI
ncbi:MAG TPA: TraR/DksA C4-type zinc finger protein [Candidatus Doudnabacteria bacterium]|nr:TraR/DksA C4-type zinc finger protein [Candidatus Doudnabacteria bacterium]